ncbi:hypothetical protein KSP39_PZI004309 [Platanthera zijinensis]|uniref:Integrase catalytic domain-containing protein n=1 Tax=Platanthera zijinensis TaxID=2320716 RepID=A0AAP0GCT4_9ASPA
MKREATDFVQRCKSCQLHANVPRQPPVALSTLQGAWPFAQWGVDLLGPLHQALGQRKFLIMAIDYFTKWVEAEPLAKITEENAKQFMWKNIVWRFGIPSIIVTDNGTQFTGRSFTKLCEDLKIELQHTAVAHPQTNGQIGVTNRTILKGLKTRLQNAGGSGSMRSPMCYGHTGKPRELPQGKRRTTSATAPKLSSRSTSAFQAPGFPTSTSRRMVKRSETTWIWSLKSERRQPSALQPTNNGLLSTTTAR